MIGHNADLMPPNYVKQNGIGDPNIQILFLIIKANGKLQFLFFGICGTGTRSEIRLDVDPTDPRYVDLDFIFSVLYGDAVIEYVEKSLIVMAVQHPANDG